MAHCRQRLECPKSTKCRHVARRAGILVLWCEESIEQLIFGMFQRRFSSPGNLNYILLSDADTLGTWTPLFAALDSEKIVVTPDFYNPLTEDSEPIEVGSGNEVPYGIPRKKSSTPTPFTAYFANRKQSEIVSLKKLMGETLGFYGVNEFGQIICRKVAYDVAGDGNLVDVLMPIFIQGYWVSDKGMGGRDNLDSNRIKWAMPSGWSDDLYIFTPTTFEALTALR